MTTTNVVLVDAKYIENAETTQFTATNVTDLVDLCNVTNQTGGAVTFSIYVVSSGGSASAMNRFINTKSLQAGETYLCPEIRGQVLENGDFIAAVASDASSLSLRVCGRQVT